MNRRLTAIEYRELVTLEYVLTWMYTDDYESDLARYMELTLKNGA